VNQLYGVSKGINFSVRTFGENRRFMSRIRVFHILWNDAAGLTRISTRNFEGAKNFVMKTGEKTVKPSLRFSLI